MPNGLVNVGNTCYLNTFLQCLYSLTSVRSFLFQHPIFNETIERDVLVKMCPVARITYKLFGHLNGEKGTLCSEVIRGYIKQLSKYTPDYMAFHSGQQHDISELWCWWMETIHNEFQKFNTGKNEDKWVLPHPFHQMCFKQWKQFHKDVKSFDWIWLYEGLLIQQIKCLKCQKVYHNPEPVNCITLDIPESKEGDSVSLADCFKNYFATEILKEWTCDDCKIKTPAEKLVRFWKAADVLVIVLKRFVYNETGMYKNKTPVVFPMEFHFLEDTELYPRSSAQPYRLMAVGNHYGGMMGGHYNATVFRDNTWWHLDDDEVKSLDPSFAWWKNNNTAYVLFYERTKI